jgi:predicted nucleotidyltransferase
VTEASRYLVALAERIAAAYVAETGPRAILLTGSAAEGVSDTFSDLDLIAYYDRLPRDDRLAAARLSVGAPDANAPTGRDAGSVIEEFVLGGVECQIGHVEIATWERDMATVLDEFTPGTHVEKAIAGLLDGAALHGNDLIAGWQLRAAAYPEGLRQATVEHYLRFFPLWLVTDRIRARDASILHYQSLVDASLNLLGVLAGLNRLYYSTFQFKRLRRFANKMHVAPAHLADRLDGLFDLDPAAAGIALEGLVAETIALVEARMPAVNTTAARRHIGKRPRPWSLQWEGNGSR